MSDKNSNSSKKIALTGIRPSGDIHVGNFLGAIRPALELQQHFKCIYFIADMHALTTMRDPKLLRKNSLDVAAVWLALGLDTNSHILFRQSDVPLVTELSWYLSCSTGFGLLEKAHAYKDASAGCREVNHGVFAYPVLMAADILLYDSDVVPVGKDQKQHVEMARDMAGSLNALFGSNALKLPEVMIRDDVMTIPGLDGRKMSKSYDNVIPLLCEKSLLRKRVMSLKTDSSDLSAPKVLAGSTLGELFKLFGTASQYQDLERRLAAGGLGWGHAKDELVEVIDAYVSAPRALYNQIRADEAALEQILVAGAAKAAVIAEKVLTRVREAVGMPKMRWRFNG